MGTKFLSSGDFDLREVFEESSAKHPLIFVLSPGKFFPQDINRYLLYVNSNDIYQNDHNNKC